MKRKILIIVASFIAIFLLYFVVKKAGGINAIIVEFQKAFSHHPVYLVSTVLLFSLSLICGITRWFVLLRKLELPLRYRDCVKLYSIGHFCNMLGPGALGGDVVKASWVAKAYPTKRTELVMSIAAERFIGLFALVVLITIICAFSQDFFCLHQDLIPLRSMIYIILCGVILSVLLLFVINWGKYCKRLETQEKGIKQKISEVIVRAWTTLRICITHPWTALTVFLISILNHFVDLMCYTLLCKALEVDIAFNELLVVSPIVNIIASIPITPGGAGVREGTLQNMLSYVNVPNDQSAALGLLMFGVLLFWAFVGAVVAFTIKSKKSL